MRDSRIPRICGALFALALVFAGCPSGRWTRGPSADDQAAAEAAVRAQADAWGKVFASKDLENTLDMYAEDAVVFPPGGPALGAKEDRRKLWATVYSTPGLSMSLTTVSVHAARSGELAYETGSFTETANDKRGRPVTTKGKYLVVWKKQADGKWKAAVDFWNEGQ